MFDPISSQKSIVLRLIFFLILVFWPLSLFFSNTLPNFISYTVSAFLVWISYFLYKRNNKFYFIALLIIPFVSPKLAIFPLIFILITSILEREFKKNIMYLLGGILVLIIFGRSFLGQTIFIKDYEKQQLVIRNTQLYPTVLLARVFQNKPRIIFDKFTNNFFAITDPNNYFFGFAPRQITLDNQNLKKFPFLSIPLLLVGIYFLSINKNYKVILAIVIASILNLSILSSFDRQDFILWPLLSLIILDGITIFDKHFKNKAWMYYVVIILFAIPEIIRVIIK